MFGTELESLKKKQNMQMLANFIISQLVTVKKRVLVAIIVLPQV